MKILSPALQVTHLTDDIIVIDDFIPNIILDRFLDSITQWDWPWFYMQDTTYRNKYNNSNNPTWDDGFSTLLYLRAEVGDEGYAGAEEPFIFKANPYYKNVHPLLSHMEFTLGLQIDTIKRVKANLTTTSITSDPFEPHIDVPKYDTWTGLLCLNDSDGPTIIYDKKKPNTIFTANESLEWYRTHKDEFNILAEIHPVKNKFVLFNGDYFHSGTRPCKHKNRLNLNLNWYKQLPQ